MNACELLCFLIDVKQVWTAHTYDRFIISYRNKKVRLKQIIFIY